jgi:hypothetical protein
MPQEPSIPRPSCSFCGRAKVEACKIIDGPAERGICDQCVGLGLFVVLGDPRISQPTLRLHKKGSASCDFCGRKHKDVWKLLIGASCNICSQCIGICCEIIKSETEGLIDKELVAKLRKSNEAVKGWAWDWWWGDTYFQFEFPALFRTKE